MELLVVCIAALLGSTLTLFSGFGLGTLLMPVVALFFPLDLAIAMTGMVHLASEQPLQDWVARSKGGFTAIARYLTSTVGFRWWLAERIDRIYLAERRGG